MTRVLGTSSAPDFTTEASAFVTRNIHLSIWPGYWNRTIDDVARELQAAWKRGHDEGAAARLEGHPYR